MRLNGSNQLKSQRILDAQRGAKKLRKEISCHDALHAVKMEEALGVTCNLPHFVCVNKGVAPLSSTGRLTTG